MLLFDLQNGDQAPHSMLLCKIHTIESPLLSVTHIGKVDFSLRAERIRTVLCRQASDLNRALLPLLRIFYRSSSVTDV